jgi:hypothetical protein
MPLTMIGKTGVSEASKKLTKEEILKQYEELEVKADVYSRTDWEALDAVLAQLKNLDAILLDIYTQENETFLQSNSIA